MFYYLTSFFGGKVFEWLESSSCNLEIPVQALHPVTSWIFNSKVPSSTPRPRRLESSFRSCFIEVFEVTVSSRDSSRFSTKVLRYFPASCQQNKAYPAYHHGYFIPYPPLKYHISATILSLSRIPHPSSLYTYFRTSKHKPLKRLLRSRFFGPRCVRRL